MATDLLNLGDRVVVVSGAAGGGIGTSVTRLLAQAGATVVAVSRSQDNLDSHIGPLVAQGLPVVPVAADASTDSGIATAIAAAREAGPLHGLVNVAGGAEPATWMPSTRVSRDDWRNLFLQNLETMFFMSQAVAVELQAQGRPGSIVSVSSISGMNTAPLHIGYGTAKAAMVAATRTMAVELAQSGIRVNAVAPGVTATPASLTYTDHDEERDRKAIAMGRRGTPDEIAGAIAFLLSDLSTYVTGQTLLVDGGLNLRWTHLDADNTSLFLKDQDFREAIKQW
ncbi:SDR family oxidoreductase [Mycobacterium sp. OTB74]|uniref:SDR family NAD(P)-dependent oxidoreductase n=1 Tax=Mycobacterium sp. OTB74 TaxID=1853452 RepID=UPI002472FE66|nr:SDR family oxidoreductase [Mycobacterium sp. OTB74]MDH6247923.1 3-oxoacyl-[acyl-carrier protein] reductase [Mycobacterium sp. OTB74]